MSDNAPLEELWLLPPLEAIQSLPRNAAVFLIPPGYEEEVRAEIGIPLSLPAVYIRVKGLPRWQGYTFDLIGTPLADTPHGPRAPLFHLRADIGSESFSWAEMIRNLSIEPLVAWRRRVFCPRTPVYIEARWRPDIGVKIGLVDLQEIHKLGDVRNALKGLLLLQEMARTGRPKGSSSEVHSDEEFLRLLRDAYQKRLDEGYRRPRQIDLAMDLLYDSEDTIQRRLDALGLEWKTFQAKFFPRS